MKLLVIQFDDSVDTSALIPETDVDVTDGTTMVAGSIQAQVNMVNPPVVDVAGDYIFTPSTPIAGSVTPA